MTCYYYCDGHRIVVFEDYWGNDADAKIWTPEHDAWVHCPGSTGIARKVFFDDDCHGLSEDAVPAMQQQLRKEFAQRQRK